MPVSLELKNALDNLNATIEEALSVLRSLPASERAFVDINDNQSLWYSRQGHLFVFNQPDDKCVNFGSLPITQRISVAKLIPELIDNAVSYQSLLTTEINDIVESIEHANAIHSA